MQLDDETFERLAADVPDAEPHQKRKSPHKWRREARHWRDVDMALPMDRNEKVRLIVRAQALEASSRQSGRQNGSVSRIGLIVLRCLLFTFHGRAGRCYPSYDAIMLETGLCRQSVRNALFRLERCGLVRIMRRLEHRLVSRINQWTGEWQSFTTLVQTSNAYAFDRPSGGAELLAPPEAPRAFPEPAPGGLLPIMRAVEAGRGG